MSSESSESAAALDPPRPDEAQTRQHLARLARPYQEAGDSGLIEIVGFPPSRGAARSPRHFPPGDLDAMTAHALAVNADAGAYVGAALRRGEALAEARAKDEHVAFTRWLWLDFDDGDAATDAPGRLDAAGIRPALWIVTGRVPALRRQCWIALAEPADPATARDLMRRLIEATGADPSPKNPSRVMRVAGTVSWPKADKADRVAERVEIESEGDSVYTLAEIGDALARLEAAAIERGGGLALSPAVEGRVDYHDAAGRAREPSTHDRTREQVAPVAGGFAAAWARTWRADAMAMLARIVAEVETTPESGGRFGGRNNAVSAGANLMGRVVKCAAIRPEIVISELAAAGERTGLSPGEARAAAEAGVRDALAKPIHEPMTPEAPPASSTADAVPGEAEPGPIFAPASQWADVEPTPRRWLVRDWIPAETVTLFYGDGGTGKSTVAAQLAVSTALGREWLRQGVETPGPALFLSAEDDADELHRRLSAICEAEGVGMRALDRLHVRSLVGEDAVIARLDRAAGALVATPLFHAIERDVAAIGPALLVLDTLADLHTGDEINRAHARQFVGLVRGLAHRRRCAVVVLAHPSLTGMSSGSGLSGSTAWNGSVRSRLFLERITSDGEEADPDARRLSTKKANYARAGQEIALRYQGGAFVADASETALDRLASASKAERVFLKLLRTFADEGQRVSAKYGSTYAPARFAERPDAEGVTKDGFRAAMNRLFAAKKIVAREHGKAGKERSHIVERHD